MRQKYSSNSGSGWKQAVGIMQRVSVHFFASVISSLSDTNLSFASCPYHRIQSSNSAQTPSSIQTIFIFSLCATQSFNTQQAAVPVPSLSPCLKQPSTALWLCTQHCMSQPTGTPICPEVMQCKITFREYLHNVNSSRKQVQGVQRAGFNCASGKLILKDYPNKISAWQEYSPGIWRHPYRKETQMHGSALGKADRHLQGHWDAFSSHPHSCINTALVCIPSSHFRFCPH